MQLASGFIYITLNKWNQTQNINYRIPYLYEVSKIGKCSKSIHGFGVLEQNKQWLIGTEDFHPGYGISSGCRSENL